MTKVVRPSSGRFTRKLCSSGRRARSLFDQSLLLIRLLFIFVFGKPVIKSFFLTTSYPHPIRAARYALFLLLLLLFESVIQFLSGWNVSHFSILCVPLLVS